MGGATGDDPGYWPSRWPGEDGGPRRTETPRTGAGLGIRPGERLAVTTREAIVATMVVLRDPGEVYLLRHTGGPDAISWVERIDPTTLEVLERSPDLPGGKTWPGGVAAHANGVDLRRVRPPRPPARPPTCRPCITRSSRATVRTTAS